MSPFFFYPFSSLFIFLSLLLLVVRPVLLHTTRSLCFLLSFHPFPSTGLPCALSPDPPLPHYTYILSIVKSYPFLISPSTTPPYFLCVAFPCHCLLMPSFLTQFMCSVSSTKVASFVSSRSLSHLPDLSFTVFTSYLSTPPSSPSPFSGF